MKLLLLKRKAANHYRAYHSLCDKHSCGANLAEHISAEISKHKIEFNRVMDKIAKIDPGCPQTRL